MPIASDITALVGNTPIVRLNRIPQKAGCKAELLAKLESFNPTASVKDRIAASMIKTAEEEGKIAASRTILIEPTSGNTGIALAMIAAAKGYRLILTMPETMSKERRSMLRAYGAELRLTAGEEGIQGAIKLANDLVKETPESYLLQQFDNPANPEVHQATTGEEIWSDCDGQLDGFIAGVGTGGTITGCARVLKTYNPKLKVFAIEPAESQVLIGNPPGAHRIEGIGAGFIPKVLDQKLIDEIIPIHEKEAMEIGRQLAREEGLLSGISSGAAVAAALKIGSRPEMEGKRLVMILPSFGERYLSTTMFSSNAPMNPSIDGHL
tara:strand:+ start:32 stop:1000 length:969 start_codon:yes stop_codon:yes gene_type:complete